MPRRIEDTIIIEPKTRIASFGTLGYFTAKAVNGAIAGTLYGKDREKKSIYYKSKAYRTNKQVLSRLSSEVYSYLNSVISDFADPQDYFFRLWVRIEIDRKTGKIVSEPLFEVYLFKYTGKLGGKYVEGGDYSLEVILVGREGTHITPLFVRGISRIATVTKLVKLTAYDSYKQAPKEVQEKITPDAPFLIIDENPMEIKLTFDKERNIVIPFIEEGKQRINFETKESIESFILGEVKLKPEIRKSGTIFQLVDDELKNIQKRIQEGSIESKEPDLLRSLKLETVLSDLRSQLERVDQKKLSKDEKKVVQSYSKQLEKSEDRYIRLSQEWEGFRQEIEETKKDMEGGEITYEQFSTIRVRRSKALKSVEQELIDFQEELKREFIHQLRAFLEKLKGKRIEKK